MPSLPGTTAMMPPLTPLLAGMPIRYAHWTGEVVHAARVHNAQDVPDVAEGKSPLSSRRVHAAVCQRGCHDRQVLAGDVHRTWPQVEGEGRLDVPREHAVATHEIGRGPVAVRRTNLGFEGVLVRLQAPVSGVESEGVQYAFERLFCSLRAPYKVSCSERSRVDHRIVRAVVALVEDDGVESVAARLHPYPLQNAVPSASLKCQAVDEHLGDGLHGERSVVIASVKDLAVCGREADGERFLLGFRDLLRFVIAYVRVVVADDLIVV